MVDGDVTCKIYSSSYWISNEDETDNWLFDKEQCQELLGYVPAYTQMECINGLLVWKGQAFNRKVGGTQIVTFQSPSDMIMFKLCFPQLFEPLKF